MENEQITTPEAGSETPSAQAVFETLLNTEESPDQPEVVNEQEVEETTEEVDEETAKQIG